MTGNPFFDWFAFCVSNTPLLLTLVVGLVICFRQRKRRPKVATILGLAIVLGLALSTVGMLAIYLVADNLTFQAGFFMYVAGETIKVVMWSLALCSGLDFNDDQKTTTIA